MDEKRLIQFVVTLTPRQREVLQALCVGLQNDEIAERLFLSPKTVAEHITEIRSRAEQSFYSVEPLISRRTVLSRVFNPIFTRYPELVPAP